MALVCVAVMSIIQVGLVRVMRHRVQSAADLSVLAAAAWAVALPDRACDRALAVAIANGARLDACTTKGGDVQVSVSMDVSLPLLGVHEIGAMARAGPATTPVRWSSDDLVGTHGYRDHAGTASVRPPQ